MKYILIICLAALVGIPSVSKSQKKVLYYRDFTLGLDRMQEALDSLGYQYTITDDNSTFQSEIAQSGKYDIAIYFSQDFAPDPNSAQALANFISAGGDGLYDDWTNDNSLAALFGATYTFNNNLSTVTVTTPQLTTGLPYNPFSLTNPGWGIFSSGMTANSGSMVDATFENGDAAIVSNSMRTSYVVGFLGDTPPFYDIYRNLLTSFGMTTGTPSLSINDVAMDEGNSGNTLMMFTVSLSGPSSKMVKVNYTTVPNTAKAVTDFALTAGTLTFAPGETHHTVTVSVVGDTKEESDETFKVKLTRPKNATIADGVGVGTILNDDGPSGTSDDRVMAPDISISNARTIAASPNPAVNMVSVRLNGFNSNTTLQLTDFQGKVYKEVKLQAGASKQAQQFDVSRVANGSYFLVATDDQGSRQTAKIIVSH